MKKYKYDIYIILIILAACLVMYLFSINKTSDTCNKVVVYVDGELYTSINLDNDTELLVNSEYGSNLIVIENSEVFVKDSDCINNDCINMGRLRSPGRSIICLPNRLEICIEGSLEADYDEITS